MAQWWPSGLRNGGIQQTHLARGERRVRAAYRNTTASFPAGRIMGGSPDDARIPTLPSRPVMWSHLPWTQWGQRTRLCRVTQTDEDTPRSSSSARCRICVRHTRGEADDKGLH